VNLKFTLIGEPPSFTKIVYLPLGTGGPPPSPSEQRPRLEYRAEEGNFSFLGDQIGVVESPLGSLITVTLKSDEFVDLKFTLVLPPIITEGGLIVFESIAVKTETPRGGIAPGIGVQLRYRELLRLNGEVDGEPFHEGEI
jgi:hypothetical protein